MLKVFHQRSAERAYCAGVEVPSIGNHGREKAGRCWIAPRRARGTAGLYLVEEPIGPRRHWRWIARHRANSEHDHRHRRAARTKSTVISLADISGCESVRRGRR